MMYMHDHRGRKTETERNILCEFGGDRNLVKHGHSASQGNLQNHFVTEDARSAVVIRLKGGSCPSYKLRLLWLYVSFVCLNQKRDVIRVDDTNVSFHVNARARHPGSWRGTVKSSTADSVPTST
jgi:hypothetical protein